MPNNAMSLKDTPTFNGTTKYCGDFNSSLTSGVSGPAGSAFSANDLGVNSLRNLEHQLQVDMDSGPIIGLENPKILLEASFGSKKRSRFGSKKRSRFGSKKRFRFGSKKRFRFGSKKRSKRRSKRRGKKSKGNKSRSKKRSRFGSVAFKNGVIPNAPGYPSHSALGLPEGVQTVNNIYQTWPNPMMRGAPLARPYGPRDQIRMPMLVDVHGFGSKKSKRRSRTKKSKKSRKFGSKCGSLSPNATPGSNTWTQSLAQQTYNGIEYAQPYLAGAKGDVSPDLLYFQPGPNFNQRFELAGANVPMQFTNNQMNTPLFTNKYGSLKKILRKTSRKKRSKKKSKKRKFSKKKERKTKRLKRRSLKRRSKFGAMTPTSDMTGPNNVAYRDPFLLYHAGGTTVDFATGQLYSPIGVVGGPTNSTGAYASVGTFSNPVLKVQPDGMTPNAYLNTAAGLKASSSGVNGANKMINNGLGKNSFGNQIYSPISFVKGSGLLTLSQPLPAYLDKSRGRVNGDYVAKFGQKNNRKSKKKKKVIKQKPRKIVSKPKSIVIEKSNEKSIGPKRAPIPRGKKKPSLTSEKKKPDTGSKAVGSKKNFGSCTPEPKPQEKNDAKNKEKTITLDSKGKITIA